MKLVRTVRLLFLLCFLLLISGCTTALFNPLERVKTTPVPGTAPRLHAASASDANVNLVAVPLYFRFLNQPMLAAETRVLSVPRDESVEFAIVKAILGGPSAGYSDLSRLFPRTVEVESVVARENILFITFSEALLNDDNIPADWDNLQEWELEAPLRRKLTVQSVVASVTEYFPYTGVQILVHWQNQAQTSMRLDNSYFLSEVTGLSEPQIRDESILLTPYNTALCLLEAWKTADLEALYAYISNLDRGEPKPSFQAIVEILDKLPMLADYCLSGGGSVSADGQTAVITVDLIMLIGDRTEQRVGRPFTLVRENDMWRIGLTQLQRLMTP